MLIRVIRRTQCGDQLQARTSPRWQNLASVNASISAEKMASGTRRTTLPIGISGGEATRPLQTEDEIDRPMVWTYLAAGRRD